MLSPYRFFTGAVAILLLAAPALAVLTADTIVLTLTNLRTKSQEILDKVESLNAVNAALYLVGGGPIPQILDVFDLIKQDSTFVTLDQLPASPDQSDSVSIARYFQFLCDLQVEIFDTLSDKILELTLTSLLGVGDDLSSAIQADIDAISDIADTLQGYNSGPAMITAAAEVKSKGEEVINMF